MAQGTCAVSGCNRPVRSVGLCNAHHLRKLRHGDPLGSARKTMRERFESKVIRAESGCWEWSGAHFGATGYAIFNVPSERGTDPRRARDRPPMQEPRVRQSRAS